MDGVSVCGKKHLVLDLEERIRKDGEGVCACVVWWELKDVVDGLEARQSLRGGFERAWDFL